VVVSAASNPIKTIEKGAGWFDYFGPPPADGVESPANKGPGIDPVTGLPNVTVVPGSLLGRSLVAQTIFNNKFLLGFAPEQPPFFLVPGDGSVTIVWEPSLSEEKGDPFFGSASDPASALFNPNYRGDPALPAGQAHGDVEGYRLWRGTAAGVLEPFAQFDYADPRFVDFTCETVGFTEDVGTTTTDQSGATVAVVGFAGGETCGIGPEGLERNIISAALEFNNGGAGGVPGGGMVRTQDLSAVPVRTNVVSESDGFGPLTDTDVPFVFTDAGQTSAGTVHNNFTYFYAVSAFDVNSQASGPISLRSPRAATSVVARKTNSNISLVFDATISFSGDDGVALDTNLPAVQPDPETGIFPGPQPPANNLVTVIAPPPEAVANLLGPGGGLTAVIDSVVPIDHLSTGECIGTNGGSALIATCWKLYMSFDNGVEITQTVREGFTPVWSGGFGDASAAPEFPLGAGILGFDDGALEQFGIPAGFGVGVSAGISGSFSQSINYSSFEGQSNRRADVAGMPLEVIAGGSRWFDGTEETIPDPTTFTRVGHLEGVDTVWAPIHHTAQSSSNPATMAGSGQIQCFGYFLAMLSRAADVRFTWEGGTPQVRDVTHNVDVPFSALPRTSYGFMNTDGNGNGVIDWQDFDYLEGVRQLTSQGNLTCEFILAGLIGAPPPASSLEADPVIQPTFIGGGNPLDLAGPDPMPQTGTGFGLYINGERYIFEMSSLPADGTVWTLRTYTGTVLSDNNLTDDPSNYRLTAGGDITEIIRPPMVAGLTFNLLINDAGQAVTGAPNLKEIHTVPDPYLGTSTLDLAPTEKRLQFVGLPQQATIRIYSLTGILVRQLEHDDAAGGGRLPWDLRNRNNQFVASGVYFFHVITPDGQEHVGKFTVVNFAAQ
jgi:hypothetical protein